MTDTIKISRDTLEDLRDLAFDEAERHRQAMGVYRRDRQARMWSESSTKPSQTGRIPMVKRYTFFAYLDDEVAELDCHEEDDGAFVLASDFDALAAENARLRAELAAVREQQAIARRAADRIVQLCTTPHESKGRFIRRVQSVIEWEAQAISAKASP